MMIFRVYGQYRTGRLSHHLFSDTAEQHLRQPAMAMSAHHDHIHIIFFGITQDFNKGVSLQDEAPDCPALAPLFCPEARPMFPRAYCFSSAE